MWLLSQLLPPPAVACGSVSGVPIGFPAPPPVKEANHGNGKCFATYWSEYCGLLLEEPVPLTRDADV